MSAETVAASFVSGLIDYAATRGVERSQLLAGSGISHEDLRAPDERVPLEKYIELMRLASQASADPAFALHFGETVDIREMSIVALISQSCEDPSAAIDVANRYSRLDADVDTNGENRFRLVRRSGFIWFVDCRLDANSSVEITESAFARMIASGRRIGVQLPVHEIHFTHSRPEHAAEYDRIFGVPVIFDTPWNAIGIAESVFAEKIASQPVLAGKVFAARADALMAELERQPFQRAVEACLRTALPTGSVTASHVAASLGVSRQTLYRRLKAENLTYEKVLDHLRHKLAEAALADRRASVSEVAYALGFADHSSFTKAFKRWTGGPPGQSRRRG